jgi:hypothetical protein
MSHNLNLKLQHCDLAREKKTLTEEEYTIAREENLTEENILLLVSKR